MKNLKSNIALHNYLTKYPSIIKPPRKERRRKGRGGEGRGGEGRGSEEREGRGPDYSGIGNPPL